MRIDPLVEQLEEETPRKFRTLELQGPPESFPESFRIKKRRSFNKGRFELIVANALWLQEGYRLRPKYRQEVTERFDARLEELDLVGRPDLACDTINNWAAENTRGRILEVLSPGEIDSLTRLILSNATCFKDDWLMPFAREDTRPEPFHLLDGPELEVPTMHQTAGFHYYEARGIQAVKMPYSHPGLSMTVVLPKHIRRFEASLTPRELDRLLDSVDWLERVQLALPRYRFAGNLKLVPPLCALGLAPLFGDSADLSGISNEPGVHVDRIKQLTWLQIDEEGTEAAAVTTMGMVTCINPRLLPAPKVMIVDRPYWFFIRDERSGTMLFAGRVGDPS